jgi:Flp pilus assembly protein TadG
VPFLIPRRREPGSERWARSGGRLLRALRDDRGGTAVEFALVATPCVALLIAVMETVLVILAQQTLQTATTDTARLIMTGQAQTQGLTASQFQSKVCQAASSLFSCSGIYVNVQKFSSFSSITTTTPLTNGNFNSAAMGYTTGGPGDIVLVQVFYQWPVVLGPLGFNLTNMNGNYRLLVGTAVFRNEPY